MPKNSPDCYGKEGFGSIGSGKRLLRDDFEGEAVDQLDRCAKVKLQNRELIRRISPRWVALWLNRVLYSCGTLIQAGLKKCQPDLDDFKGLPFDHDLKLLSRVRDLKFR